MRLADAKELPQLESIRQAAFVPIFASFRSILGDEIYELAQAAEDDAQDELLASAIAPESDWQVYVAEASCTIIGFILIQMDSGTRVGEIGLNAVRPKQAGQGIGTLMYSFAISRMKIFDTCYGRSLANTS